MKTTPLYHIHQSLHAAFNDYDGWTIPQHFGDPETEYHTAKTDACIIDHSSMGLVKVSGTQRFDYLNRMTTNEIKESEIGTGIENGIVTEKGRMLGWMTNYFHKDYILIFTHRSAVEPIVERLQKFIILDDVKLENITGSMGTLTISGAHAGHHLHNLSSSDLNSLTLNYFKETSISDIPCTIARGIPISGDTFHIFTPKEYLESLWNQFTNDGILPMGEEAYNTLRIEAGIPVSPNELNEQYNPLEARLMDNTISFTKGCYPGQEVIARLDSHDNVKQHLAGFLLGDQQPQNMAIEINGQTIGTLTSFGYSYDRKSYIGLGYIRKSYEAPGTIVNMCAINDEIAKATVTPLPFP